MKPKSKIAAAALGATAALLLAACSGSSSDTSTSEAPVETAAASSAAPAVSPEASAAESAATASELHATVLDERVAALAEALPASTVTLPNGKSVAFDEGEPLSIAFIGYGKGFDYSKPEFAAASDMAAELGITIDEFDPSGDPQKQISQLQDIMASGKYNAVIAYPLSTDVVCDLMSEQMPDAGILTVAIGNAACATTDSEGVLTTVPDTGGTDYVYPAWAEQIAAAEKGGTAIVVTGPELDYTSKVASSATEAAFAKQGITIAAVQRTDFTQADALQKIQDALQAHPEATMVVSSFPEGTQAALTAVESAGKAGSVRIYDFGANAVALPTIESGNVSGSTPFYPYTKVKTAIQALLLARGGEAVDELIPYSGHQPESMRAPGATILFVTPENVEAFASNVAEY